jgi:nucleoside-diphosphate-sugar epimerase
MADPLKTVLVTGGAGYVGAVLTPLLLEAGYTVRVLDLFLYGEHVFDDVKKKGALEIIKGDLRDQALLRRSLAGVDAVIHLACISNDPSSSTFPGRAASAVSSTPPPPASTASRTSRT